MMKTHNWFGFRANRRGHQARIENGYGVYTNAEAMMTDYAEWESNLVERYGLNDEAAFRAWIGRHYAEDPQYATKLATTLRVVNRTWQ